MKKWKKRVLFALTVLAVVVVSAVGTCWVLLRGTPHWYRPGVLTGEQRQAVAQSAENKLILVYNAAAQARADERAAARRNAATLPTSGVITISFTDDEINALLEKWSVWPGIKAGYQRFMSDPCIVIQDGRLILAGQVSDLGAVASLHFTPRIDEQGRLDVELSRVLAGKLPLPAALLNRYQAQAANALAWRMPGWRAAALIDPSGSANSSAISVLMGQLLTDVMLGRSSEPALFVPLLDRRNVAVKVLGVKIEDHTLTLRVQPMSPDARSELLARIKDGRPR